MTKKKNKKDIEQEQEPVLEQSAENNEETAAEATEEVISEDAKEGEAETSEKNVCEEKEDDLTLVKKLYDELNDKHLRLQADFDNFRRRTQKEKAELILSGGEKLLTNILPVMDDFERAIDHVDKSEDITAVKEGIHLIHDKFTGFLGQNGVKAIETENADFDTDLHEAITKFPAPSEEMKGKVIDCTQKGYYLNDKVIRFAKVVVGE